MHSDRGGTNPSNFLWSRGKVHSGRDCAECRKWVSVVCWRNQTRRHRRQVSEWKHRAIRKYQSSPVVERELGARSASSSSFRSRLLHRGGSLLYGKHCQANRKRHLKTENSRSNQFSIKGSINGRTSSYHVNFHFHLTFLFANFTFGAIWPDEWSSITKQPLARPIKRQIKHEMRTFDICSGPDVCHVSGARAYGWMERNCVVIHKWSAKKFSSHQCQRNSLPSYFSNSPGQCVFVLKRAELSDQ